MIKNPKEIVEKKIVENLEGGNLEVQQNGIDLTIESIEEVQGGILGRDERAIKGYQDIPISKDEWWDLVPGVYSIMFQQKVEVPENMCAQIVQRSTLNRMGGFILSGVYDSGFKNQIGAILRVNSFIKIQKGARVAQIVFQEADPASLYEGVYQGK